MNKFRLLTFVLFIGPIVLLSCEKEKSDNCNLLGYGLESDGRYQITFDYRNNKAFLRIDYGLICNISTNPLNNCQVSDFPGAIDSAVYVGGLIKILYKYLGNHILMEHDEFEYDGQRIVEKRTYDHYNREEPVLARVQDYKYNNSGLLNGIDYMIYLSPGNTSYISDTLFKYFYYDDFKNLVKTVNVRYLTNANDSTQANYDIEEFLDYDNMINPFYGMPFQDLFKTCYYGDGISIYSSPTPSVFVYTSLSKNNFLRYKQTRILNGDTILQTELSRSFEYNTNGYPIMGKYSCE
ncbi:MAG: hypothetical protein JXA72_09590 [Bacteroidales bacterium]|nr:hypothetical protein [Bacteroidales bacterium]